MTHVHAEVYGFKSQKESAKVTGKASDSGSFLNLD